VFKHKFSLKFGMVPVNEMAPGIYASTQLALAVARRSISKILLHNALYGDIECLL